LEAFSVVATAYDENAIMNYCSQLPVSLSAYELLFTRMVYPDGSHLPIVCGAGCFSGSSVFLRSNGSVQDSFTAQGAYPWWSSGDAALTWRSPDGVSLGWGSTLTAGAIGPGVSSIRYAAAVVYTGEGVVGSGSVHVSNAEWTAIASTIL
jgi:hypothetical protein